MPPTEPESTSIPTPSQQQRLTKLFTEVVWTPLYEPSYDEDLFNSCITTFEVRCNTELGIESPGAAEAALKPIGFQSYEIIKEILKKGPPAFAKPGWVSEMMGQKVDLEDLLKGCEWLQEKKEFKERIVLLDIWATWCSPCIEIAPHLSELSEKYPGVVSVIGINNDCIFEPKDKGHDIEKLKTFLGLDKIKGKFRYTVVVDVLNRVREELWKKCGFEGVPTGIMLVDGAIAFVGDLEKVDPALEKALESIGAAIIPNAAAKEE
ncbi:hypothetical protein BGZ95_008517 [Linnemannia exigua]|uniref:Thioredoxin domain-containing protein n=1 Tax=Linnemannia exigua TaxID=604196 RepID=A0AAD4DDZ8_9FUNG|nr:hypothetical protein BGZ95_008517 [Linnemannia exigua]